MQGQSPPKTGPEIQPAENRDIHPSAGWPPPTLSSVLALRGGQNLVGRHFTPIMCNPPPPQAAPGPSSTLGGTKGGCSCPPPPSSPP